MMAVDNCSIEAYKSVLPHLCESQLVLLDVFRQTDHALCDRELAKILRRPINTITPRRLELEKKRLITRVGQANNEANRRVNLFLPTLRAVL